MAESPKLTATIVEFLPQESGTSKSGKDWVKQGLLVETDGQYPKKVLLTLFGDKIIGDAERYSVGDNLTFHLNIEAREWNGKWFNDVGCWKIEMSQNSGRSNQSAPPPAKSQPAPASKPAVAEPLPFASVDDGQELPF